MRGAVNELAELVADLLEATGLVPADRLAAARAPRRSGLARAALVDEGLASSDGVARSAREQYRLPLVDIVADRIRPRRVEHDSAARAGARGALPYRLDGDTLRVAIADPANVTAIDELRLATPLPVELAVAPRRTTLSTRSRASTRANDALGARGAVLDELQVVEDDPDDLEADDGVSDAPLVRLVNSIIFQAAEDGASDIHFEPQEDCLVVRFRIDGVLQEVQRIPKQLADAASSPASRCSRSSTSPSGASRRTAASP